MKGFAAATILALSTIPALAVQPPAHYAQGVLQESVAPWDGSAVRILFANPADRADFMAVSLYHLPIVVGRVDLDHYVGNESDGGANACNHEKCEFLPGGVVAIGSVDPGGVISGRVEFRSHPGDIYTFSGRVETRRPPVFTDPADAGRVPSIR